MWPLYNWRYKDLSMSHGQKVMTILPPMEKSGLQKLGFLMHKSLCSSKQVQKNLVHLVILCSLWLYMIHMIHIAIHPSHLHRKQYRKIGIFVKFYMSYRKKIIAIYRRLWSFLQTNAQFSVQFRLKKIFF